MKTKGGILWVMSDLEAQVHLNSCSQGSVFVAPSLDLGASLGLIFRLFSAAPHSKGRMSQVS